MAMVHRGTQIACCSCRHTMNGVHYVMLTLYVQTVCQYTCMSHTPTDILRIGQCGLFTRIRNPYIGVNYSIYNAYRLHVHHSTMILDTYAHIPRKCIMLLVTYWRYVYILAYVMTYVHTCVATHIHI